MSWDDQGRQEHGWFGNGTAPAVNTSSEGRAATMFDPANAAQRIDTIAHSAVAHMPRADRHHGSVAFDRPRLECLRTAMMAWTSARSLSHAAFLERFIDPSTSDAAVEKLRATAEGARTATTHEDLVDASSELAGAMRDIGLERWSRFRNDAAGRADANRPVVMAQATTPNTVTDARPAGNPTAAVVPGRYVDGNPQQWIGRPAIKQDRGGAGNWTLRRPSNASIIMAEVPSLNAGLHLSRIEGNDHCRTAALYQTSERSTLRRYPPRHAGEGRYP